MSPGWPAQVIEDRSPLVGVVPLLPTTWAAPVLPLELPPATPVRRGFFVCPVGPALRRATDVAQDEVEETYGEAGQGSGGRRADGQVLQLRSRGADRVPRAHREGAEGPAPFAG